MESYIQSILDYIVNSNVILVYVFFFFSTLAQMLFPPYPGDTVLVFQGYFTTLSGLYNFQLLYFNAMSATFVGSYILFHLGYNKGSKVLNYKMFNRFITDKHKARAERLFEKYGVFAVGFSKFVPGVNALMVILSGTFKMDRRKVYISVLISASIHHLILILLGRFLGYNMNYIKYLLHTYNSIIIVLLCLLLIAFIVYKLCLKSRKYFKN